jgi:hypothetical protein
MTTKKEKRSAANQVSADWAAEIYDLPTVCNFFRNKNADLERENNLKHLFSIVRISRASINPAFIRENCPQSHLVNGEIKKLAFVNINGARKLTVTDERRVKFSAGYVKQCILNADAKINAAAGSKTTVKKNTDQVTDAAAEVGKTAEIVKNNKKRNAAAAELKIAAAAAVIERKNRRNAAAAAK